MISVATTDRLRHVRERRRELRADIDLVGGFEQWQESCVPSYCHRNWAAALLSWDRLFTAVDIAKRNSRTAKPRVLDFGASVGELHYLLPSTVQHYSFIEQDDAAAAYLQKRHLQARRTSLTQMDGEYDWIFAIDALEHNTDFAEILAALINGLSSSGILVISGPTENALYRIGRRLAGFKGGYHETTVHEIESAAARSLARRDSAVLYPIASLFRITAWSRISAGQP